MIAVDEDLKRDPESQDRQFTQLMNQVKELKEENIQLRNRLNEKDTQDKENKVHFPSQVSKYIIQDGHQRREIGGKRGINMLHKK